MLEADLELRDLAGKRIARLDGLRLLRLAEKPMEAVGLKDALLREAWMAMPLPLREQPTDGSWLVFAGAEGLADRLVFLLAECGQRATVVRQGARYCREREQLRDWGGLFRRCCEAVAGGAMV